MGRIFEKRKHSIFKTAAQNSKVYSKYSKQLYMAAKNGVPDPTPIRPYAASSREPRRTMSRAT